MQAHGAAAAGLALQAGWHDDAIGLKLNAVGSTAKGFRAFLPEAL